MNNGKAYQRIWDKIELDNVIDFKDVAFANECGAQWRIKGNMSDLPKLFKTKNIKQDRIDALNKITKNLEEVKKMMKEDKKRSLKTDTKLIKADDKEYYFEEIEREER